MPAARFAGMGGRTGWKIPLKMTQQSHDSNMQQSAAAKVRVIDLQRTAMIGRVRTWRHPPPTALQVSLALLSWCDRDEGRSRGWNQRWLAGWTAKLLGRAGTVTEPVHPSERGWAMV